MIASRGGQLNTGKNWKPRPSPQGKFFDHKKTSFLNDRETLPPRQLQRTDPFLLMRSAHYLDFRLSDQQTAIYSSGFLTDNDPAELYRKTSPTKFAVADNQSPGKKISRFCRTSPALSRN
jgi:hypothetical protein